MPATAPPKLPSFLAASAALPGADDWTAASRDAAREIAEGLGLPDRRNEGYRFTNLKALESIDFVAPTGETSFPQDEIFRYSIPNLEKRTLVFLDGTFLPEPSHGLDGLPDGVTAARMTDAVRDHRELVERHLGKLTDKTDDVFAAANASGFTDGLFVHVAEGVSCDRPFHLLFLSTGDHDPYVAHSRNLIVAEAGASVTVVEHYASASDDAVYFNNSVTEIVAAENARVDHYLLQKESEAAFNMAGLYIHQSRESDVHSHTVMLGAKIARNAVSPVLAGEKAHCLINGLYVAHGEQVHDNAMFVVHDAEDCASRQFYKGILNGRSRGVFTGRIRVTPQGQLTDAVQSNRNMLLSDDARSNARPQLEIYADDVKCTHGCTTGEVDPEAVFYFRSRGLPEDKARAMLIYAFAAEGFQRMELIPVREWLAAEMIAKLPGAEDLSIEVGESPLDTD